MSRLVGTADNPEAAKLAGYPWFDWLRIILASVVAFGHFGLTVWPPAANLAVRVFFALSGWLIGGILLRTTRDEMPRFFYNRATRIWIPYFFAVALIYATGALRDGAGFHWFRHLFYDVTFTHNWFSLLPDAQRALTTMPLEGSGNHFWSIAAEEQFYLAAPLFILLLPFGRGVPFWIVLGLALSALGWNAAPAAFGVAAAILERARPGWSQTRGARLAAGVALLLALAAMARSDELYSFASPVFAIALVLLFAREGARSRLDEFVGGVSYPFYLLHVFGVFVVHLAAKLTIGTLPQPWDGLLSYATGLAVGIGGYLVVDRNVLRLRSRYYTVARGSVLMAAAYLLVAAGMIGGISYIQTRQSRDFPPAGVDATSNHVVGPVAPVTAK